MWSVERAIYCRRCGKHIGIIPSGEVYSQGLIADLNGRCPRCKRILEPSKAELHHELYFAVRTIVWKLTHPWRLFK